MGYCKRKRRLATRGFDISTLSHIGVLAVCALLPGAVVCAQESLPDAPSATRKPAHPDPCATRRPTDNTEALSAFVARNPCLPPAENPYKRFLDSTAPHPLTPAQKAHLAVRDVIDPFTLLTILANSAYTISTDSHTAYGPGLRGFRYNAAVSLSQDVTGEFIGTFAVCSIAHEDPHYHRDPQSHLVHRFFHAIGRTVIAQHDDGRPMPNFQTLVDYPVTALIANTYVPGIATDAQSTVDRILLGFATDPIGNLITEFLPDVARRIHIHILFVQRILNQVAATPGSPGTATF